MFCYRCGNKIDDDSIFCSNCGASICENKENKNTNATNKIKTKLANKNALVAAVVIIGMIVFFCSSSNDKNSDSGTNNNYNNNYNNNNSGTVMVDPPGRKNNKCSICGGRGRKDCTSCNGGYISEYESGQYLGNGPITREVKKRCVVCKGSGYVKCYH